ncbi:hypothetical protein [Cesiribacter andamanensis]|nr:hypothetical protein [Cesiribacter andamanensis]
MKNHPCTKSLLLPDNHQPCLLVSTREAENEMARWPQYGHKTENKSLYTN